MRSRFNVSGKSLMKMMGENLDLQVETHRVKGSAASRAKRVASPSSR
jgi:hypothetical protein